MKTIAIFLLLCFCRGNFEAGIFTDTPSLVASAMDHFDGVWSGMRCKGCLRRKFCGDPIDEQ